MSISEFWKIYNKEYKVYSSPGFCVVDYPLSGDTGCFLLSIYVKETGKFCVDKTIERCSTSSHREYDTEDAAVERILNLCAFYTGHKYEI